MLRSEIIYAGYFGGIQHLLIGCKRRPHHQVLLQSAIKQHWILRYIAHRTTQINGINLTIVYPINQNSPISRLIQTQNQTRNRRLATTNPTNHSNAFTSIDLETHLIHNGTTRTGISKTDVFEFNVTFEHGPWQEALALLVLGRQLHVTVNSR